MSKKINPRKIPRTEADCRRAYADGQLFGIQISWIIMFSTLRDKFGFSNAQLSRAWQYVEKLSEEVAEGRVSAADLNNVLRTEAGLLITK